MSLSCSWLVLEPSLLLDRRIAVGSVVIQPRPPPLFGTRFPCTFFLGHNHVGIIGWASTPKPYHSNSGAVPWSRWGLLSSLLLPHIPLHGMSSQATWQALRMSR